MSHAVVQWVSPDDTPAANIIIESYTSKGYNVDANQSPTLNTGELTGALGHLVVIVGGEFANPVYNQFFQSGIVPSATNNVLQTTALELGGVTLSSALINPLGELFGFITGFGFEQVTFVGGNTQADTLSLAQQFADSIPTTIPVQIGEGAGNILEQVTEGITEAGGLLTGGLSQIGGNFLIPIAIILALVIVGTKIL